MDKHAGISEAAIRLLARLLQNLGVGITQLRPETLQKLMKALVFLIDGKRQVSRNWGLDVCMFMFNLIGSANYLSLMSYTLTEEETKVTAMLNQIMTDAMNSYKKNGVSKGIAPLAAVLKERRSKVGAIKQPPPNENYPQQSNTQNYPPSNYPQYNNSGHHWR